MRANLDPLRWVVVGQDVRAPWLESRTRRSLGMVPYWEHGDGVVKAGVWLRAKNLESWERVAAWGRGVISVGLDRSEWSRKLLWKHGGDFGWGKGWRPVFDRLPPVCVFPRVAGVFARGEGDVEGRALEVLRSGKWRVVHVPEWDVEMDEGLRVAQVVTSVQRGGAERVAVDLAERLSGGGASSLLVSLGRAGRKAYVPRSAWVDLGGVEDRMLELGRVLRGWGADLVHGHLLGGEMLRQLRRGGWKMVTTLHNARQAWPAGVNGLGANDVDLWIACSKAVEEEAQGMVPVRTIWNGVGGGEVRENRESWRTRLGAGAGDVVLMALANVRPQKNFEMLPAIWREVRERLGTGTPCHLWVAGEGTASMSWPEGMKALGCIEDTAGFLNAGDVLICPSRHEGLSLVQLEALGVGRPVVSTRVGGAAEVAGVELVEREAGAGDFASAVLRALRSPRPAIPPSFRVETMVQRHRWMYDLVMRRGVGGEVRECVGLWVVTNHLGTGGAQASAIRLLSALKGLGVVVRAAVMEEEGRRPSSGTQFLRSQGIPVWSCLGDASERADAQQACGALLRAMAEESGGDVFFWNLRPVCKVLLADGLWDRKIWDVSPGEMNFDSLEQYFEKPWTGVPYLSVKDYGRRLAGAVVKYAGERERAEEMLGCAVRVISNGVPLGEAPEERRKGPLRFVTVARLSPDKKLEQLVEAWRGVEKSLPRDATLHVAGGRDGEKNAEYARGLRRSARGLRVIWHDHVEDVRGFLRSAHVFVLISEPAGCPNAGLEALAAGLPVVATDHGGAGEQVESGDNGYVVARGDSAALGLRMLELARDGELRGRMGMRSRQRAVERFSLERMARSYFELLTTDGGAMVEVEGGVGAGAVLGLSPR